MAKTTPQPVEPYRAGSVLVTHIEVETPSTPATYITAEDDTHWWVLCEGGCGRTLTRGKRTWRLLDPQRMTHLMAQRWKSQKDRLAAEANLPYVEIRHTAPFAGRCAACGPFPQARKA